MKSVMSLHKAREKQTGWKETQVDLESRKKRSVTDPTSETNKKTKQLIMTLK